MIGWGQKLKVDLHSSFMLPVKGSRLKVHSDGKKWADCGASEGSLHGSYLLAQQRLPTAAMSTAVPKL